MKINRIVSAAACLFTLLSMLVGCAGNESGQGSPTPAPDPRGGGGFDGSFCFGYRSLVDRAGRD